MESTTCLHCGILINTTYCPECGLAAKPKRIDQHYIIHEIKHVLHVEKGILYTFKGLLLNPGKYIQHFIIQDRSRLVKPILFIILTSLVYSLVSHYFHIEEDYFAYGNTNSGHYTRGILKWIQDHYGYSNILMGIFIAWWLKLFFRKLPYNVYEILVLLCFVMGMAMFIGAIFSLLQGVFHWNMMWLAGIISLGYCVWAIGQFFDRNNLASYLLSGIAYFLGMLSFMFVAIIIGVIADIIVKH